jgi:hypothetical protein
MLAQQGCFPQFILLPSVLRVHKVCIKTPSEELGALLVFLVLMHRSLDSVLASNAQTERFLTQLVQLNAHCVEQDCLRVTAIHPLAHYVHQVHFQTQPETQSVTAAQLDYLLPRLGQLFAQIAPWGKHQLMAARPALIVQWDIMEHTISHSIRTAEDVLVVGIRM